MRRDPDKVDRIRVACDCGFVRSVANSGDFPDAFSEVQKHVATAHPSATALAITMQITVTEAGE